MCRSPSFALTKPLAAFSRGWTVRRRSRHRELHARLLCERWRRQRRRHVRRCLRMCAALDPADATATLHAAAPTATAVAASVSAAVAAAALATAAVATSRATPAVAATSLAAASDAARAAVCATAPLLSRGDPCPVAARVLRASGLWNHQLRCQAYAHARGGRRSWGVRTYRRVQRVVWVCFHRDCHLRRPDASALPLPAVAAAARSARRAVNGPDACH